MKKEQLEFLKLTLLEMKKHVSYLETEIKSATQNERRDEIIRKIRSEKRGNRNLFQVVSSLPQHELDHLFKTLPKYHGLKNYKKEFQTLHKTYAKKSFNVIYKLLYGSRLIRFLNAILKVPTPKIESLKYFIQKRKQWPNLSLIDKWITSLEKVGDTSLSNAEYLELQKCPNMPQKVCELLKLWLNENNAVYKKQYQDQKEAALRIQKEQAILNPSKEEQISQNQKGNQYLEALWNLIEVVTDVEELSGMLPRKEYKYYDRIMRELRRRQELKLSNLSSSSSDQVPLLEIEKLNVLKKSLEQHQEKDQRNQKEDPYFLLYALTDHGNSIFANHLMSGEVAQEYYNLIERSLKGLKNGSIWMHPKKIRKFTHNEKLDCMYEVKDKKIRIYFRMLKHRYIMIYALRFKDTDRSMTDMAIITRLIQSLEPQVQKVKTWIEDGELNESYLQKNKEIHMMVLDHLKKKKRGKVK